LRFGRSAVRWSWLHVPVLAFLAVNIAATVFAADPYVGLFGTHSRMLGLTTTASWVALYFATVMFVRTHADGVAVIASALGSAFVMLVYEVIQLLHADPFRWNVDPSIRPISTNGQATTLGTYLTTLALASLTLAITADVTRRWRVALAIASAALLCGAAFTATRSSLVGIAAGAVVLVGMLWLRAASARMRRVTAGAAAASVVVLIALVLFTPVGSRLFEAPSTVAGESEDAAAARLDFASLDVRAVLYGVALAAVRERPVLGYGPDNFVLAMARHRPELGPEEARFAYATSAHGWIGQTAVDSGVLGLVVFGAILVVAAALALRTRFSAATCLAAVIIATYLGAGVTTVNDIASGWIVWVALGAIALATSIGTTAAAPSRTAGQRSRREPRRSSWLGFVPAIIGAVALLTFVAPMQASRAANVSREARLSGQVPRAVAAGLEATQRDAGRTEYWHYLGLAYVAAQRWADAEVALTRAVATAPWDARKISDLIQVKLVQAQRGDKAALDTAVRLSGDLVRADPNFPDAQVTRANVMQFSGNPQEAAVAIERAFALYPSVLNAQWYVLASQIYVSSGRPADATRVVQRGLERIGATTPLRVEQARALLASGRPAEARAIIDGVLAAEPTNVTAQQLRAQIMAALGQ
jgi:O-antigen ligase/cytochrome c-type biogenesis protein CcmH/NrfG